jgi:hypothetical protein
MGRADKPGQDAHGSPGDFLARWSRRKIDARDETARPDDGDAVTALPPGAEAGVPQARAQEQALTDADMPPVETLNAGSDFTPFMSPGVSDGLRQQALRILFRQPAYNITDGLNDYDGDYTQFAGLGSVVTHEMKRLLKRELEADNNRRPQADPRAQASQPAGADVPADVPVDPAPQSSVAHGQLDTDADDDASDREPV